MQDFKVNTGGLRNEKPLTQKQITKAVNYSVELNMPRERIAYSDIYITGYGPMSDTLLLGTDLYPIKNTSDNTNSANSRITWRGTIGHELIGHREAAQKGWTQDNETFEEAQASIRAARFTPNLNLLERIILLRDAVSRLPKGIKIRNIKDSLHISER